MLEAKKAGKVGFTEGEYLQMYSGDVSEMIAQEDGVFVNGSAWTNRYGGGNEPFGFFVSYDTLNGGLPVAE